jgi:hypothetical protein
MMRWLSFRGWILCCGAFLLAACSPSVITPPVVNETSTAQLATSLPASVTLTSATETPVLMQNLQATPAPTNTPLPTETLLPSSTPTLAPTALPVAGIEVYDLNGINQAHAAGAYWIRRNALPWSAIESAEGERNWGAVVSLEQEMQTIAEQGMETILIIQYAPSWAQAALGNACGPIRAEKLETFGAFMYDVVARYSQPPYNVKFYELGNEPDVPLGWVPGDSQFGCWIDLSDPTYNGDDYANMLKVVYPQVKAANPDAQVLIGGLLMDCDPLNPPQLQDGSLKDCSITRFFEMILQSGGAEYFDGVSFHAYDYYSGVLGQYSNPNWHSVWNTTGPVLIAKARYLRALLDVYHRPDAYLLNTETALLCGRDGSEAPCQTEDHLQTKTSYVVQANTVAQAEYLIGNIWYSISGWRGSGLVDGAGQPLPTYQAVRFNAQMLTGMNYTGAVTQFDGVAAYEFLLAGRRLWVAWSRDGGEHTIHLSSTPTAAYDMQGNALVPIQDWPITIMPVYLEWQE